MISIAVCVRYAGTIDGDFINIARKLITDDEYAWVLKLGLALRLGHTLSGGTPGVLSRSKIDYENGPVVLTLSQDDANFLGPSTDKRLKALGNMLEREWKVEIDGK